MPPLYNKKIVTHALASLLDRLIDLEPEAQQEAQPLRALPLREWRQVFFRDLVVGRVSESVTRRFISRWSGYGATRCA